MTDPDDHRDWFQEPERPLCSPTIAPVPVRAHEEDVPRAALGVAFALGFGLALGLVVVAWALL